jgi:rubrerythrin
MKPTQDLGAFLAHAVALENDAAERYDELADAMETHNNDEVAELFRKMAYYSRKHLAEAAEYARNHAGGLPSLKVWEYEWPEKESPESAAFDSAHYLMTPYHALQLAKEAEVNARDFYSKVAESAQDAEIEKLSREFAEEEAEHVEAIEEWILRYPEPEQGWDEDLDPPSEVDQ